MKRKAKAETVAEFRERIKAAMRAGRDFDAERATNPLRRQPGDDPTPSQSLPPRHVTRGARLTWTVEAVLIRKLDAPGQFEADASEIFAGTNQRPPAFLIQPGNGLPFELTDARPDFDTYTQDGGATVRVWNDD